MIKQREVLVYGDPRLKQRAVECDDPAGCAELIARMRRVTKEFDGAGLAAPQIGDSIRVIIWELAESAGVLINPVIEISGEEEAALEGCLSVPGMAGEVVRPQCVTASGYDEHGNAITIKAEGMLARVIQHEVDHLDGILFVERATPGTLKPVPLNQVPGI